MEESASSFSAIFNGKKHTLCLQDAEIEITNGKCSIKGHAAFLREDCPGGYHYVLSQRSKFLWVFFYIVGIISINGFILVVQDVRTSLFWEKSMLTTRFLPPPMFSCLLLLLILTVPSPKFLTTPTSAHRRSPTRKSVRRSPIMLNVNLVIIIYIINLLLVYVF